MKTDRYAADELRFIINLLTALLALGTLVYDAATGEKLWVLLILAAFSALFIWLAYSYAAVVTVRGDTISMRWPLGKKLSLRRDEIASVTILDPRVTGLFKGKLHGSRYILFSKKPLSEDELLQLSLSWPPRDMIYLTYTRKIALQLQEFWNGRYEFYNADDIDI